MSVYMKKTTNKPSTVLQSCKRVFLISLSQHSDQARLAAVLLVMLTRTMGGGQFDEVGGVGGWGMMRFWV